MRPAELHSPSAEKNCMTENASSLRFVKVATPPCAAKAAIPCGFAASKSESKQIGIYEIGGIDIIMWNELGISGGTAIVILIALYFVIKWAVKNGIKEAYSAITGKKTDEDIKNEKELKELGLDSEDQ